MMDNLVVIGGGWAGCAASLAAAKKGMRVLLLERTDRLLGSGLVGGIMRNNGRYTAAEELILMGAGELIAVTDKCSRHTKLDFPGHRHASLYDIHQVEHMVAGVLRKWGVEISFRNRVVDVIAGDGRIEAVRLEKGQTAGGAVFIDASGTAGAMNICRRSGHGCAMCVYRCPAFGPRVSPAVKAGAEAVPVFRPGGQQGYFSGSCELEPFSLDNRLLSELRRHGRVVLPLPAEMDAVIENSLEVKACRQYALSPYRENIILLDTGAVKMMSPYFPLQELRRLAGLEKAVYRDPLGGSVGNSIRLSTVLWVEDSLAVPPFKNLLACGERAGLMVGHTEAIITGTLAGYNAWLISRGLLPRVLPRSLASGELIAYACREAHTAASRKEVCTLSGGVLWENLLRRQLYTTDTAAIRKRVEDAGLIGVFAAATSPQ